MASPATSGYVREFTRHASDVLLNLDGLRQRHALTDITLRVGGRPLQAHKAVLTACSGFFYSIFLGQGGPEVSVLTLPSSIDPAGFQALLDFMYTSRLLLTPRTVAAVLAAASYLRMEHVVESCHRFIQASHDRGLFLCTPPSPGFLPNRAHEEVFPSPAAVELLSPVGPDPPPASLRFPAKASTGEMSLGTAGQSPPGQPASPHGSSRCAPSSPEPHGGGHWKKQRFIVLSALQQQRAQQAQGDTSSPPGPAVPPNSRVPPAQTHGCPICDQSAPLLCSHVRGAGSSSHTDLAGIGYPEEEEEEEGGGRPPAQPPLEEKPYKCHFCSSAFRYKGNLASHRSLHTGEKPYRCRICGAQFNRPANLKTHLRIHSGEKPFKCETCGSRFVQVAHLRAHVLIHTGEKPYPCDTCGTCFRHLQTLKSHIRIHTGEKPYQCEECNLRFRHKSQLRLHLRQKHGAITNTKIRYKVLDGPYATLC